MSAPDVRARLRAWVLERTELSEDELSDDTPLVSSRLITSLQITDLLLLIEELRGAPLDPASLRPGVFNDIETIHATFFDDAR